MSRNRRDKPDLSEFGDIFMPSEAAEPILSKPVRGALLAWLTEIFASDELAAVGIGPRKRALFDGPPGVGKTTLAHHLAARLGLPMLAVRPDRVIDRYVGATSQNVGKLFDAVREGFRGPDGDLDPVPVVLFLDEFDAIGSKRRAAEQAADEERNAWVNTLLQRIEQHDGFIIAATNFGKSVDPAIWRRFDMQLTLELPGEFERREILRRYLAPFGMPQHALELLGAAFASASPALIRQFCEALKRSLVIGERLGHDMSKRATFDRITASVHPHPDLGKPPMWSTERDHDRERALDALPWPLPMAADVPAEAKRVPAPKRAEGNIVPLARKGA